MQPTHNSLILPLSKSDTLYETPADASIATQVRDSEGVSSLQDLINEIQSVPLGLPNPSVCCNCLSFLTPDREVSIVQSDNQTADRLIALPEYLAVGEKGVADWLLHLDNAMIARKALDIPGISETAKSATSTTERSHQASLAVLGSGSFSLVDLKALSLDEQKREAHALIEVAIQLQRHVAEEHRIFTREDFLSSPECQIAKFSPWWREQCEKINSADKLSLVIHQRRTDRPTIYHLPFPVLQLTNLKGLTIITEGAWHFSPGTEALKNLESLSIQPAATWRRLWVSGINSLATLEALKVLRMSHSTIKESLKPLCHLGNLAWLEIDDSNISMLPHELGQLSKLETLRLGFTGLRTLPSFIDRLPNLKTVSLPIECFSTPAPENMHTLNSITITRQREGSERLDSSWFAKPSIERLGSCCTHGEEHEWFFSPHEEGIQGFRTEVEREENLTIERLHTICQNHTGLRTFRAPEDIRGPCCVNNDSI